MGGGIGKLVQLGMLERWFNWMGMGVLGRWFSWVGGMGRWFGWVGILGRSFSWMGVVGEMVPLVKALDAHAWYLELDSWYPLKKPDAMTHIYNPTPLQ